MLPLLCAASALVPAAGGGWTLGPIHVALSRDAGWGVWPLESRLQQLVLRRADVLCTGLILQC